MIEKVKKAYYLNNAKTILFAEVVYANGNIHKHTVDKHVDPKTFNRIEHLYTVDSLNKETSNHIHKTTEDTKYSKEGKEDHVVNTEFRRIFLTKELAMAMPEVIASTNKKLKRRIRKATEDMEIIIAAAAIVRMDMYK